MTQTFQGLQPAIDFAQVESKKQNKKLYVFLTRRDGVQYIVADAIGRLAVVGKLMGEYGSDPVIVKPPVVIPPPAKVEEKLEPEPVEEPNEIIAPSAEDDKPVEPETAPTKPKKTTKKKE